MANARIYLKHPAGGSVYLGKHFGAEFYNDQEAWYFQKNLNGFFEEVFMNSGEEGVDKFYIEVEW